jgi:hypothetical protein
MAVSWINVEFCSKKEYLRVPLLRRNPVSKRNYTASAVTRDCNEELYSSPFMTGVKERNGN